MKYIKLFEQHVEDWNEKLLDYSKIGDLNGVKQSIKNGVDVNCKDNYGWTPLHWSSLEGYLDIVKYLIENGANWFIKNDDNEYFIDLLSYENKEIIKKHYPDKYKEYEMRIEMDKYNL